MCVTVSSARSTTIRTTTHNAKAAAAPPPPTNTPTIYIAIQTRSSVHITYKWERWKKNEKHTLEPALAIDSHQIFWCFLVVENYLCSNFYRVNENRTCISIFPHNFLGVALFWEMFLSPRIEIVFLRLSTNKQTNNRATLFSVSFVLLRIFSSVSSHLDFMLLRVDSVTVHSVHCCVYSRWTNGRTDGRFNRRAIECIRKNSCHNNFSGVFVCGSTSFAVCVCCTNESASQLAALCVYEFVGCMQCVSILHKDTLTISLSLSRHVAFDHFTLTRAPIHLFPNTHPSIMFGWFVVGFCFRFSARSWHPRTVCGYYAIAPRDFVSESKSESWSTQSSNRHSKTDSIRTNEKNNNNPKCISLMWIVCIWYKKIIWLNESHLKSENENLPF